MAEKQQIILPENYTRTIGREAQRLNILACRIVAETVRTTLGPKGMDKMLVDSLGDVVITNDGVTILDEMEIEHPAAKMMVEVAKTQEEVVGDGTTTAVVLAGELLKEAEKLIDQGLHPTVIARGYKIAQDKAEEILKEIAINVDVNNKEMLKKIVATAMTGKGSETVRYKLSNLVVDAVLQVAREKDGEVEIDKDDIKIEKRTGGGIDDSKLVKGIILDKEKVHPDMPTEVENARILLLDAPLEVKETEIDAQIRITDPEQLERFIQKEQDMLKEMVEKIKKVNANVVICQKGIDDTAQFFLAKAGIYAVRRVKSSDMEKLAKATGARIITNLDDISEEDLGYAGKVREVKLGGETLTFIEECKNPRAVTLLIRGGTEHVIDEIERAVSDAIGDLIAVIKDKKIVAGGGSPELEVAMKLREYAHTLQGREQLAVRAFADALEVIPRTLAENSGMDSIDTLVKLRALHEKGKVYAGVDAINEKIAEDMRELNVLEPLRVKIQAIKSANEAATMILRIDDVIAAGKLSKEEPNLPKGEE